MLKTFTTVELDVFGELVSSRLLSLYEDYDEAEYGTVTHNMISKQISFLENLNNKIFKGDDVFCIIGFDRNTLFSLIDSYDVSQEDLESLTNQDLIQIRDITRDHCLVEAETIMDCLGEVVEEKLT